jgi:hypothetical protein
MISRREFLQTLSTASAAVALTSSRLFGSVRSKTASYFRVHPFVEAHPNAVFIMRTDVDVKTNSAAVKQAGLTFGQSVFGPSDSPGVPMSYRVAIKPNIVMMPSKDERNMGIVTDPYFVEGIIESLKLLGLPGSQFYLREVNDPGQFENSGYAQMAQRTGADLRKLDDPVGIIAEKELQWVDVPSGQWFTRIPYLWPVNSPDTWLLNIAKMKTHLMGMSLCAKNIQGANAIPYVVHCAEYNSDMGISSDHIKADANASILDSYNRHVAQKIPRWDRPGSDGGLWQETWATRCLDNNSVTTAGLNIIEAVYGREGPFGAGPGEDGRGIDHIMNLIVFGKNPFHVDTVGLWLGGHTPGNFGYLHMAIERGLSSLLDPAAIPLYEWKSDGSAILSQLTSFDRTPLRTQYLCRNYNGQVEPEWHLVNEPYEYSTTDVKLRAETVPQVIALHQNYPNPFNGSTWITFEIPRDGHVIVEVLDVQGRIVDRLMDRYCLRGPHLVRWDGTRRGSGMYFYRLMFERSNAVRTMVHLK